MLPIFQLKSYLLHPWFFKRKVTHKKAQLNQHPTASVEGLQTWQIISTQAHAARYLYVERGRLKIGAYIGEAEQAYQFEFKRKDQAQVYFNDGRFFYAFDLKQGKKEVEHQCCADHYLGKIKVISKTQYSCTWYVKGPQKDYCSQTLFSRKKTIL